MGRKKYFLNVYYISSRINMTKMELNWRQFNILYHQIKFFSYWLSQLIKVERVKIKNPEKKEIAVYFHYRPKIGHFLVVYMKIKCNAITNRVFPGCLKHRFVFTFTLCLRIHFKRYRIPYIIFNRVQNYFIFWFWIYLNNWK